MDSPRFHVLPPEGPVLQIAGMPLQGSLRWCASDEDPTLPLHLPVFVSRGAFLRVNEHAASDLEREVGGVLVGDTCMDEAYPRQYLLVSDVLPARFTRQGSVFLTFTQDSLVAIHAEMEERFPGKRIVGWYHTHPGMGIFLSPYDTWLHQNFFPEPWQVALVIEPRSVTGGFFVRQADGTLDPVHYTGFYEPDGSTGVSSVSWNNLQPLPVAAADQGVEYHE